MKRLLVFLLVVCAGAIGANWPETAARSIAKTTEGLGGKFGVYSFTWAGTRQSFL
jgi:hypothetical protein